MLSSKQKGFSLIELLVVMAIFFIVSGAVFMLLNASQQRYRAEQQFLESFQGARLALDLIIRDIHNAGYPPPYSFPGNLAKPPTPAAYPGGAGPCGTPTWTDPACAPTALQERFALGIVGVDAGGNVSTTCTVGGLNACSIPNSWHLILALDADPENKTQFMNPAMGLNGRVEWVRYQLMPPVVAGGTSTLIRAVGEKTVPGQPTVVATSNIPFVENVAQNPGFALGAVLPLPLPGPVTNSAVFTYECDPTRILPTGGCLAENVKNVYITLRVQSTRADPQTQRYQRITVQGAASRLNPTR